MSDHPLTQSIQRIRSRLVAVGGTTGLFWMIVAAMLWLAVGVWLDLLFDLSPQSRIAIVGTSLAAATALFVWTLVGAFQNSREHVLARRLDRAAGTGGQILCGVELLSTTRPALAATPAGLTAGLASLAISRAVQLAEDVPSSKVISTQTVRRAAAAVVSVMVLALIFSWLMPRLTATEWNRFRNPFGDHPPYTNINFDVQPGDASVVYGSGIEIHVSATGAPVDAIELIIRSLGENTTEGNARLPSVVTDEALPMFPESGGQWRATLANVVTPMEYFVRARSSRSRKFRIAVVTVPRIEDAVFRITPPAYTAQSATEGPLPSGGLAGLPGTKVRATIRSNRPLAPGRATYLTTAGRKEFTLTPPSSRADMVSGEFEITAAGRVEFHVTDVDGQSSTEPFVAPVTMLADERPFVRLLQPRATSFAAPTAVIPVVMSAEDDYGISRLQLFRNLNDSSFMPMDVPLTSPTPRTAYQMIPLPLAAYQLEPGDVIKLFARVEDTDPHPAAVSGAVQSTGKGSESPVATIQIISQEQFEQFQQSREGLEELLSKYQQVRRRLESLTEQMSEMQSLLENEPETESASEAARDQLHKLARRIAEEAEALRKIAENRLPFAIDEELTKELQEQAEMLRRLQQRLQELADNAETTNETLQDELKRLEEELATEREEFEQDALQPLEFLAKVFPLKQDEARFVQLYHRQRDLADRLESLKRIEDTDDPAMKARMRDLEAEQQQIRLDLDALLADIDEHAAVLPDDERVHELRESALEFVAAVRDCGADGNMKDAEAGLAEFSGQRGYAGAKDAADRLEELLAKSEAMGGQAGVGGSARFQPSLQGAMQETMNQLLRSMGLGSGQGGGSGFSMRRNSMDNVGLYGNNPSMDDSRRQGQGLSSRQAAGGRGQGDGTSEEQDQTAGTPLNSPMQTTGNSEAFVPLRYRRQVGRYFQRIADELDSP